MKKIFILIIFAVIIICAANINYGSRVFEVKSPVEIYIDINNNLVFDEKNPVVIDKIHFVNSNIDLKKYPFLNLLSESEKFFLEYKAHEAAQNILKNRYVKLIDNDIKVDNKKYSDLILASKFVFDDTQSSQLDFISNIKNINLDDYVILNTKNKKYHKLDCIAGRKSAKYKIVKLAEVKNFAEPCKSCHLPLNQQVKKQIYSSLINRDFFTEENIKIFFIDLNKIFKPDNSCRENACKALINEINSAKNSIDVAIYGINNQPKILNALIAAYKRGVKIRRVYDYSAKKYYEDNDKLDLLIPEFKTDEFYDKNNSSALMHNKYFIFDKTKVFTGSSNISSTDLSGFNANYTVLVNSKHIAQKYIEDFEQMYKGIFHKSKKSNKSDFIEVSQKIKVKPLFSPQDNIINTEIIPLINSAQKYIYMPAFFITDKGIKDALINAHLRGVEIKIINDATNAHSKFTIHRELRAAGIKVKTENYAGKMHAKAVVIDNMYSIIGSMNFTRSGNSRNDENVLIIENSDIANYMRMTFLHLWNKIPQRYETFDPKAESHDSIGSCNDGIDNDFDEKIDLADEGCFL